MNKDLYPEGFDEDMLTMPNKSKPKTTKCIEQIKLKFWENFVVKNSSSASGAWWVVPYKDREVEIADPHAIWEFIEQMFEPKQLRDKRGRYA